MASYHDTLTNAALGLLITATILVSSSASCQAQDATEPTAEVSGGHDASQVIDGCDALLFVDCFAAGESASAPPMAGGGGAEEPPVGPDESKGEAMPKLPESIRKAIAELSRLEEQRLRGNPKVRQRFLDLSDRP